MPEQPVRSGLFKIILPEGFQRVRSASDAAATIAGPGDRWMQLGFVKFRRTPVISDISEKLLRATGRLTGPTPFIEPMKDLAHNLLERSAEPGTLQILSEENSTLASRPALLVISTYTRGRKFRSHLYYTLTSRGEPIWVGFTAPQDDDMMWTHPILDRLELLR